MESKTWLTKISKMITSAITGMEHPRAIPIVAAVDNPLLPSVEVTIVLLTKFALSAVLFFVEVTTVLLTHFALSAEDVNKPMHH